jgi:HSP20 family protein
VAQFSFIPSGEASELADDLRELFEELASALPPHQRAASGECRPTLDVLETDTAIEVIVDMAGIPLNAIRVLFRGDVLLIAGEKAPSVSAAARTFHLVEREFGRFARAVRLNGAFDLQGARETLDAGELTILLPKLSDRRGRAHRIPVQGPNERHP